MFGKFLCLIGFHKLEIPAPKPWHRGISGWWVRCARCGCAGLLHKHSVSWGRGYPFAEVEADMERMEQDKRDLLNEIEAQS